MISFNNTSIRRITITILVLMGLLSIVTYVISSKYFLNTYQKSQASNIEQTLKKSVDRNIKKATNKSIYLAHSLAQNKHLQSLFISGNKNKTYDIKKISHIINEPFDSGFISSTEIDLIGVRIYDKKLNLLKLKP